jgi:3-isopropylmalate/(R)-2-methylmalate dehydratase large subunit
MEGMTVCNLLSKWAPGGMIAPDQTTFDYLEGRLYAQRRCLVQPYLYWKTLKQMQMQNLMKKSTLTLLILNNGTNLGLGISKSIPDSKDVVRGEETA